MVDALRERGADLEALQDPCFPFAEPEPKDPSAGPPAVHLRPVLSGGHGGHRAVAADPGAGRSAAAP